MVVTQADEQKGPASRWRRPARIGASLAAAVVALYAWPRPWTVYTTPGGYRITHVVLGHFTVPNEKPVLRIRYETRLSLDDTLALKVEAKDVWPRFREDVERGGYVNAAFLAQSPPSGPCFRHKGYCRYKSYGFLMRKRPDGKWYFVHDTVAMP